MMRLHDIINTFGCKQNNEFIANRLIFDLGINKIRITYYRIPIIVIAMTGHLCLVRRCASVGGRKNPAVRPIVSLSNEDRNQKNGLSDHHSEYPSFRGHVRDVIKLSLITSWPEISRIRNKIRRWIKIIVFIICIVGFIVQTRDFLKIYLAYPTTVNQIVSFPSTFVQPAVTVCNRNKIKKSLYCTKDSDSCFFLPEAVYCEIYKRNCPDDKQVHTGGLFLYAYVDLATHWSTAYQFAHNSTLIANCTKMIEGERSICSSHYHTVPFLNAEGEANLCHTIDTQWEQPDATDDVYANTLSWNFKFNLEPEEYVSHHEPTSVHIAVHDRRKLINPFTEGYLIGSGWHYDAFVTMEEEELLAAPFDTNCTDYLKLWKERNGTGPLNKMMCSEECKLNTLLARGLCIDRNDVSYPHTHALCNDTKTFTVTSEIVKLCYEECGRACRDTTYNLRIEPSRNISWNCSTEWCRASEISLTLYFNRFQVTKLVYQPKFESIQFYSYIGGYMGMWLGLSLVSTFDLLEMACAMLYYPLGKWIWNKRWRPKFVPRKRR